jgi:glycyl-tRNA synthetase beta chain
MTAPLLLEIGCEEIPARMIGRAATDLRERIVRILDQAGLAHGEAIAWGGCRRLGVRVEAVEVREGDRDEEVLGPPVSAAFGADGLPTAAAAGFARKQGVDPSALVRIRTPKGNYAGFRRTVSGRGVGEVLAAQLPPAVSAMSFPKTMRWHAGAHRWVRPVHWVVVLLGSDVLDLELFGVRSGRVSRGHRFLGAGGVEIPHPDGYVAALRAARVIVDPGERRDLLLRRLDEAAAGQGGTLLPDDALLEEVRDLVEWPGAVGGTFDRHYLELPREILVATLRHHQKAFAVQGPDGRLLPAFLAVANLEGDPGGHVRRGNEWVVGGRLADARFFWGEDRKSPLAERLPLLERVAFHARLGSYAEKAGRMMDLAAALADRLGLPPESAEASREAARVAKADLVTGLVGEFPELQGIIGGLLLRAEGRDGRVALAVFDHYRPAGPEDALPETVEGCVVSIADRLDTLSQFLSIGETPKGSRDPYGLRRAANGILRIVVERDLDLSLLDLHDVAGGQDALFAFLSDRLTGFLRDAGYSANEVLAVMRPRVSPTEMTTWRLGDLLARLEAIRTVRGREDFAHLLELVKRVDTIVVRNAENVAQAVEGAGKDDFLESEPAALELVSRLEAIGRDLERHAAKRRYHEVVEAFASLVRPVDRFFADVLVIDPSKPWQSWHRTDLLARLRSILTRYFDLRELAGEAD